MATDDVDQSELAEPAGCSEATISRRMKRGGWKAEELEGLGRLFDVPASTFFKDPGDVRAAVIRRYLTAA